jgi:GNAT superfamily N-acetyltransferase
MSAQPLSFTPINLADPEQVTDVFKMRRDMFVANGDPENRFDHVWPDAPSHAAFLGGLDLCEFALLNGERVGFYSLEFCARKNPNGGYVDMLYFRGDYRGQGLGRQVIEHIKSQCRARGLPSLILHSKKENHTNTMIYAKLGFGCMGDVDDTGFLLKWNMDLQRDDHHQTINAR